jgi:beta-glucosidase
MTGPFPDDFRWGSATASYQIEGAVAEDGRGPSIWDTFSHTPGRVLGDDNGDVACDHYHRYREDVGLMAELGLHDYRFSVAWSRVLPTGSGAVNRAGLDFYSRLVDEILASGIRPLVTLYHWDLPQALQDAGGWTNRDTAARFGEFAAVVAQRLGDRVPAFTTLNEPWCSAFLGPASGVHAPGLRDDGAALQAAYHLLVAHGEGVAALRSGLPAGAEVSITLNPALVRAVSDAAADRAAAVKTDLLCNRIFLDPLLRGRLPDDLVAATTAATDWGFVRDGDLAAISAPIDFLGVNYYTPTLVGAQPADPDHPELHPGTQDVFVHPQDGPLTGMGWRVEAASLTELLVGLHRDYPGVPMVVTENGAAYPDALDDPAGGDVVEDPERADYLAEHITAVGAALDAGVDLRGYFVWSLLDNFEWAWGYSQRFGIVHVDFATQRRRLKRSARLYQRIIADHGVVSGALQAP